MNGTRDKTILERCEGLDKHSEGGKVDRKVSRTDNEKIMKRETDGGVSIYVPRRCEEPRWADDGKVHFGGKR
jgi:hypothetical protein